MPVLSVIGLVVVLLGLSLPTWMWAYTNRDRWAYTGIALTISGFALYLATRWTAI